MATNHVATALFALALLHTFCVAFFARYARRFPAGSWRENLFHLLGEVEVVFGLWAAVFVAYFALTTDAAAAFAFVDGLDYREPLFVFAILCVAATKPILDLAERVMLLIARALPLPRAVALYATLLIAGPLLGSLITEPAAMTLTALLLKERFYDGSASDRFRHVTLAVLFVNISIGGVLTSFAAPPVLMVAGTWGWDTPFMLRHFGWEATVALFLNAAGAAWILRRDLAAARAEPPRRRAPAPFAMSLIHVALLAAIVATAHHPAVFLGLFMLFLGVATVTREYQSPLRVREGLLVAFFLAGLVVLGNPQAWWLAPLLQRLDDAWLFLGATGLTAVTDNAALTYLGSRVPGLSEASRHALVAGAVAGGGLTVIANAPNPAGYAILLPAFGARGISPLKLFTYALAPTLVAMGCFWFL